MDRMTLLTYRVDDLHDEAQRRALFRDMLDAFTDHHAAAFMARFLDAVDGALLERDATAKEDVQALREEIRGLADDLAAEREANDELRSDVHYYREELDRCQTRES